MRRASALPWLLLLVAATARLLMQNAAMPPYAGLDEIFHVARLSFVYEEKRSPASGEASIPRYLEEAIDGFANRPPAFALLGPRWSDTITPRAMYPERILGDEDIHPYGRANYQAQHPSLYYTIAGPIVRFASVRTELTELRLWRLFSIPFALIVVLATAVIGFRYFNSAGLIAAALIVSIPTWQTLVTRAGNDALACALIATAIAATAAPSTTRPIAWIVEGLLWAGALAAKLYAWPVAVVVPFFWRHQRAKGARMAIVSVLAAAAVTATMFDLNGRTGNPLGLQEFQPVRAAAGSVPIDYFGAFKVFVSSLIWTAGQHGNALKPIGMALYVLPLAALFAYAWARKRQPGIVWAVLIASLAAFAVAQLFRLFSFLEEARAAGTSMPPGGKEGWYVLALAPLLFGFGLSSAIASLGRRRVILVLIVLWIVGFDVLLTEGALFHDFVGKTSPAEPTALFRWGPFHLPFTADLEGIGVGPLASATTALRLIQLAALAALVVLESKLQGSSSDDRNRDVANPAR